MKAQPVYLVTDDIHHLMARWAKQNGFTLPPRQNFRRWSLELSDAVEVAVGDVADTRVIDVATILDGVHGLIHTHVSKGTPIIALDHVVAAAIPTGYPRIAYESTRRVAYADGTWKSVDTGPRPGCPPLERQADHIATFLKPYGGSAIIVDDGCYHGTTMRDLSQRLTARGIHIAGLVIGVLHQDINDAGELQPQFDFPVHSVITYPPGTLKDWVCARDFIVGVPYGGRVVCPDGANGTTSHADGHERCVPYLSGFGDIEDWASIDAKSIGPVFTRTVLDLARRMYHEIGVHTGHEVLASDIERWPCSANGQSIAYESGQSIESVLRRCVRRITPSFFREAEAYG